MVFFIAGCAILFCLLSIPVQVTILLRLERPISLRVRAGFFSASFPLSKNFSFLPEDLINEKKRKTSMAQLITGWNYTRKHLSRLKIRGNISIGTGDAAKTAVLCGFIATVESILKSLAPGSVSISVEPDFQHPCFHGAINGMVRIKLGHIMGALLLTILRRVNLWNIIPLRAS